MQALKKRAHLTFLHGGLRRRRHPETPGLSRERRVVPPLLGERAGVREDSGSEPPTQVPRESDPYMQKTEMRPEEMTSPRLL